MDQYQSDNFGNRRQVSIKVDRSMSKLATASMVLGSLFFVPMASVGAVVTGLLGMATIKRSVTKVGYRRARMGVALGCLFTVVHAYVGFQGVRLYQAFQAGPTEALRTAQGGDIAGFVGYFGEPAIQNANAIAFVRRMEARYGPFIEAEPASRAIDWRPDGVSAYTLRFERATVPAEIRFGVRVSSLEWGLASEIESLRLVDASQGDLAYPPLTGSSRMAAYPDSDD